MTHNTEPSPSRPGTHAPATNPVAQPCHDRKTITDVLTAAFTDDPVYTWAIPRDLPERGHYLRACLQVETDFALDGGGGAALAQDRTGVTVWTSPDTAPDPQAKHAFYEQIATAAGPAAERCLHLAQLEPAHLAGLPRHVYSAFTGVLPGSQGQGTSLELAMALASHCLKQNAAMYARATSARNAALWVRYGAHQCGETMLLPDGHTGLTPILIPANRIEETLGQLHELAAQRGRSERTSGEA